MTTTEVQGRAISQDGTEIAYWCNGEGRPLVLVHGTTADHTRWATVLDRFTPHVRTCAIDRRGRGASGDAAEYALEREYKDVAAVVDELAAEHGGPVDLFGHSHGALCSLEATLLTGNVRRLVLYEAPVLYDDVLAPGVLERLDALLAEGRNEAVVETFFREVVRMPEAELSVFRTLPAWQRRVAAAATLAREERGSAEYAFDASRFTTVSVPALLLQGGDSPPFFHASTEAIAAALPDAEVAVLEGQQHIAIDTAPELVANTVLAFLARP